jgi:hypothetical protein
VSFFDQPLRVTRFKLVHAVWRRQRMEVLPGVAPVALVLARTKDTVVGLTDVRGYPIGFAFVLQVRWGLVADRDEQPPWPFPDWGSPDPLDAEPLPDALLRFGVQFADGRSVSSLDPPTGEALDPERPMLSSGPGTGGGVDGWSFDMDYRVRPLPPPGPLAFICAWPGRGIPTSRIEVDGEAIRTAADTAATLWPDDPYCGDDC